MPADAEVDASKSAEPAKNANLVMTKPPSIKCVGA